MLNLNVHNNADVVKEIIWILKSNLQWLDIQKYHGMNSSVLLKQCFLISKIAEAFSMGRTKSNSMYMINHGLAPFFKSLLLFELNK